MNTPDTKRLSETISSAASMALFLLFAVCCLVMIAVAASAYGRINENYENTFNGAAAVRYLTNKIRACESAEIVSETEIILENNGYATAIYHKDGRLYERMFSDPRDAVFSGGEEMFRAEGFSVTEKDGLIVISASDPAGNGSYKAYCRSKEGG